MPVIEVDHLQKHYGETVAVADVSFSIEEGEIFGILGPNGAGKTTTVEAIAGLREPDAGTIRVMGLDPFAQRDELRRVLGIQLQESQQPDKLEVSEALDLYASFYEHAADPNALLEALGLSGKRQTRFAKLSGGQKQRLSIALALIGNPRIAVLDELTTGLDPQARRDTWALIEGIRERGVTILLVTHSMEEAERLADRVALIDRGRVVALDTPTGVTVSASPGQVLRFRPSSPLPDGLLDRLPEITSVRTEHDQLVVSGTGEVLAAVISALAGNGIVANQLLVEQASLEDAFVALTNNGLKGE
ncbi:MAG TPA: ABC transporter ATP-binding protein [Solirubrobacteraceae bacterium]|nr:ABC transporter ATP-binding protein [Solirubrobacteraceae bacterium]